MKKTKMLSLWIVHTMSPPQSCDQPNNLARSTVAFTLARSSMGEAGSCSWDSGCLRTGSRGQTKSSAGLKTSRPQGPTSSAEALSPEDCTTFRNSVTIAEQSVQTLGPKRGIPMQPTIVHFRVPTWTSDSGPQFLLGPCAPRPEASVS